MKTVLCWGISKISGFIPFGFLMLVGAGAFRESHTYSHALAAGLIGSIVMSIVTAVYAWRNYDEIVSFGVLFWRSRVGLFDSRLKYTIGIFFQSGFLWFLVLYYLVALLGMPD